MDRTNGSKFGTSWSEENFNGATAFESMRTSFEDIAAKHRGELHESLYTFGGKTVLIRIVGNELVTHLSRPFSHLQAPGENLISPQLTIDLWNENKPAGLAKTSWHKDLEWTEATLRSHEGRFVGQQLPHTHSCLDRERNHIVASIAWHDRIFIYERAKPLARPLLEWHNDQNVQVIHTGLVARNGKGVLLVGKSGSGKSTSSLACICAGLDYLSEDYVGLQRLHDGSFVGHSLYNSVFLETAHLARFAELLPYAIKGRPPQEAKSVIILSQVFPQRLRRVVPIRALAMLKVTDNSEVRFRAASKGEALLALGPSSLLQIPNRGLGVPGFTRLAELVEQVPCYAIDLGGDLQAISPCVESVLDEVVAV